MTLEEVCSMAKRRSDFGSWWGWGPIADPATTVASHSFGPFVFGAPQNWTTDDAVEPDGEYPPDPPKCADCKGKGKVELFTGVVDCERCDGSGY